MSHTANYHLTSMIVHCVQLATYKIKSKNDHPDIVTDHGQILAHATLMIDFES